VNVTVKDEILIRARPDVVWDYTQDWSHRTEWDDAVISAEILATDPPVVRIHGTGGVVSTARYKLYDKPHRTSLAIEDVTSRLIVGGGGSWEYVATPEGTTFRQTNTIALRGGLLGWLLRPVVSWQLRRFTRRALERARAAIESKVGVAST
jgi:hypothetical protein